MPWGIAAAAVGTIASSALSSSASSSAAQTQANAANQATQAELQMFNTTQKNLQPFMQGGTNSLQALMQYLGIGAGGSFNPSAPGVAPFTAAQFQSSPGYQWQLNQGIDAIQNSAAARGGVGSGNTMKALQTYGTGLANQDWYNAMNAYTAQQQDTYNKLYGIVGTGANAAANLGGFSVDTSKQVGANIIGAGNAQATGQVGSANALTGGVNSLAGLAYQLNNYYQSSGSGGGGGSSGGGTFTLS